MPPRPPKIIIVLLNCNGKKEILECLASLRRLKYKNCLTIVVDNGSTDDSVKALRVNAPDLPIFENGKNLGFAGGHNVGIEWALCKHAEWILLLSCDTEVDPDLLNALLQAAKEAPNAKILGAKILRYHDPEGIDHLGSFWNPQSAAFASPDAGQKDHPYLTMRAVDSVCGSALFMHRSVPEKIGLLEPNFFLFWGEADFCYRARRAGFGVWTAPEAKVWRKISPLFPEDDYFWWRSRLLWIERNCSFEEKSLLYKKILIPELWKMGCDALLPNRERREKAKRWKAGCAGAFDFFRKRFGMCPSWVLKK